MPQLTPSLEIDRCPHCKVDEPNLTQIQHVQTHNHQRTNVREWITYRCARCGGLVIASAPALNQEVREIYPSSPVVDSNIPSPASDYLKQALNSLHSPAGAVMLSASAVDAMLKAKNYKEGSLYTRIDKAVKDRLITPEMAKWAHEVRLDANDPRHADEKAPLPDEEGAKRAIDFTQALAQFIFVLPTRVTRGLEQAKGKSDSK